MWINLIVWRIVCEIHRDSSNKSKTVAIIALPFILQLALPICGNTCDFLYINISVQIYNSKDRQPKNTIKIKLTTVIIIIKVNIWTHFNK